jgi:hypothetical protein
MALLRLTTPDAPGFAAAARSEDEIATVETSLMTCALASGAPPAPCCAASDIWAAESCVVVAEASAPWEASRAATAGTTAPAATAATRILPEVPAVRDRGAGRGADGRGSCTETREGIGREGPRRDGTGPANPGA